MDFQEAKDRTLWKLAFTYHLKMDYEDTSIFERSNMWSDCEFCGVTRKIYKEPYSLCCFKCPIKQLCDEWTSQLYREWRFGFNGLQYFFDKLLTLPMPLTKEETNGK